MQARGGFARWLVIAASLLVLNALYLAIADRADRAPRSEFAAFFYLANVLAHLSLGLLLIVPLLLAVRAAARSLNGTRGLERAVFWMTAASLAVCLCTGLYLLIVGNLRPQQPIHSAHGASCVAALIGLALFVGLRARRLAAEQPEALSRLAPRPMAVGLALLALTFVSSLLAMRSPAQTIRNPRWAPDSMDQEGDGASGKFFPSSNQVVGNRFFPSEYFTDSQSCGVAGCHPDIYKQWRESAHHFSSFNNQWYRKSIEYMQEVVGPQPSKWCGGCHDMAILLTEKPGTGRPRMDSPIKDQIWPPEKFPEAHAGIGCAVCHSIVHVKSTMGQGDYLADYPPMHKYVVATSPFEKAVHNFLIRRAPEPHKKTFLRSFHRGETAKFCSACHKVHLDVPVNGYRWLRGFNDYDAWQQSGVSGFGAQSFYYPSDPKTGQPAFKKCADCHMPTVRSNDAGNIGGEIHSHRFPAANTALPFVNGFPDQLATVEKFLKDGAVTVDIFALRREKGPAQRVKLPPARPTARTEQTPRAASLMGDEGPSGPATIRYVPEDLVAPLDRPGVELRRGEEILVDVVVRTRKIGHAFPGGTSDAFDIWLELQATDDRGRPVFWNGRLAAPDGPVDPAAHFYRVSLLDEHGNRITRRNAWAARVRLYAHLIPPGAADTVHYRMRIPRGCGNRITLNAKLHYRKFMHENTRFAFAGRPRVPGSPDYGKSGSLDQVDIAYQSHNPRVKHGYDDREWSYDADTSRVSGGVKAVPALPVTTMAESSVTLAVVDGKPSAGTPNPKVDPAKLRERWNDYGIGFLLQRDFRRATDAFRKVTEIAPQWPEGWVNIGRVRQQEGNLAEATAAFEQALALYNKPGVPLPAPMIAYLRARTQNFYAQALRAQGRLEEAAALLEKAALVFPQDRLVRNQLGLIRFQQARFPEAIAQFEQALAVDPEDLTAHYKLIQCYRLTGDGGKAKRHEALYYRFKADENSTAILGPYRRAHREDNVEAEPVHEHSNSGS